MKDMTPEEVNEWSDLLARTARLVARDFPDVDQGDLYQELWIFVLENQTLRDPSQLGVARLLKNQCTKMAWNHRKEHLQWTSQYSYRTSDVRYILETSFDHGDWEGSFVPADARGGEDGAAATEVRVDVMWAYQRLPVAYQQAIKERYHDNIEPPSNSAQRKTLNRAIRRLTDTLNWYLPRSHQSRPGARRVISNATAAYIIENQEES